MRAATLLRCFRKWMTSAKENVLSAGDSSWCACSGPAVRCSSRALVFTPLTTVRLATRRTRRPTSQPNPRPGAIRESAKTVSWRIAPIGSGSTGPVQFHFPHRRPVDSLPPLRRQQQVDLTPADCGRLRYLFAQSPTNDRCLVERRESQKDR